MTEARTIMSSPTTIIKLTNPGETLTLSVQACRLNQMGTYPDVSFIGIDGQRLLELRVPQKSADRQLERIGLTYQTAVGKTLVFSRDPSSDPKKPYWGITLASNGGQSAAKASVPEHGLDDGAPHAADAEHANGHDAKRAALYVKITDYVLSSIAPKYVAAGIPVTMEGTAAICATLYIQANR